eukprot:TRINITY_DN3993_c0_g1_i3.p1 TRINITY_DN3993_c0_g1~~TRINITY_DN3993_c0_g1_i3.p1  ORF type:complete len:285 (-),score=37.10 TRINITY_DN3993_c0_g1_i3:293-1147(-)
MDDLPKEVLLLIIKRLSIVDVVSFSRVNVWTNRNVDSDDSIFEFFLYRDFLFISGETSRMCLLQNYHSTTYKSLYTMETELLMMIHNTIKHLNSNNSPIYPDCSSLFTDPNATSVHLLDAMKHVTCSRFEEYGALLVFGMISLLFDHIQIQESPVYGLISKDGHLSYLPTGYSFGISGAFHILSVAANYVLDPSFSGIALDVTKNIVNTLEWGKQKHIAGFSNNLAILRVILTKLQMNDPYQMKTCFNEAVAELLSLPDSDPDKYYNLACIYALMEKYVVSYLN